jgi:hypothetical protein
MAGVTVPDITDYNALLASVTALQAAVAALQGTAPPPPPPPPPPPTPGTTATIAGNAFTAAGANPGNASPSAQPDGSVGNFYDGSWVEYQVDFGTGMVTCQMEMASAYGGGNLDLRLGSVTAPVIGSLSNPNTGGWTSYTKRTCTITATSGKQSLFVVSRQAKANIKSFLFSNP